MIIEELDDEETGPTPSKKRETTRDSDDSDGNIVLFIEYKYCTVCNIE